MQNNFIKTYPANNTLAANNAYKYTTMIRHKGMLIAFAMDNQRRIFYGVLDPAGANQKDATAAASARPLSDSDGWPATPTELIFPNEIAEAGFGVADQTSLRVFKKNSTMPEALGARLPSPERIEAAAAYDYFLSTTARLSADAPFQALTDGRHIYLFRQAIAAAPSDPFNRKLNANGTEVKDASNNPVPLVNSTLLVDRFVLVGAQLKLNMEARYQRSRSRVRPQSRKDSLDAKDLDGNFFFEPTRELKFIGNLTGGRFTVLLLPTRVAELERWQFFVARERKNAAGVIVDSYIDSFNVERAADGLFNTRGSQIYTCVDHPSVFSKEEGQCVEPSLADDTSCCDKALVPRVSTEGYAESALNFATAGARVELAQGPVLGGEFTQEVWLYPISTGGPAGAAQAIITSADTGATAAPSILIDKLVGLRVGFGDGTAFNEFKVKAVLTPDAWNHVAVTFDGAAYRIYVDGRLRARSDPKALSFAGKKPEATPLKFFGASQGGFKGKLDEVRVWNRARSERELLADKNQRLTGMEPGLVGYWRFDEAEGTIAHDQTGRGGDGRISSATWITSDAPVGENPGLSRDSFRILEERTSPVQGQSGTVHPRSVASGMTALLYYQQADAPSGYDGKQKPLKLNGRVMLALATNSAAADPNDKPFIAALDFGISASGRLAQTKDDVLLRKIEPARTAQRSINEQLDDIVQLETEIRALDQDIASLDKTISYINATLGILDKALAEPPDFSQRISPGRFEPLNTKLTERKDLLTRLTDARVNMFALPNFGGAREQFGLGIGNANQAQSLQIPPELEVEAVVNTAFPLGNSTTLVFTENTPTLPNSFPPLIVSVILDFMVRPSAPIRRQLDLLIASLRNERQSALQVLILFTTERSQKAALRASAVTQLNNRQAALKRGVAVEMNFLYADPFGLTVAGGLLGFAWTNDAPLLFDSATGKLALYFRGTDDQFFVAYYDTKTQRAQYSLKNQGGDVAVICAARSTDQEMDNLVVEVNDGGQPNLCTITIKGAGITETWNRVPRAPEQLARILNGLRDNLGRLADQRVFVGAGTVVNVNGELQVNLDSSRGLQRALAAGDTLVIGDTRATVRDAAADKAARVAIASDRIVWPGERLPIFFLEYDFARDAQTTKVPSDLYNGSLLVRAAMVSGGAVINQSVTSGATLSCKWTAEAPGSTLQFDGLTQHAVRANTVPLKQFDAESDVTLEAWVRPRRVNGQACVIQHNSPAAPGSPACSYTLGLREAPLTTALAFDGANDFISIPNHAALNFAGLITIEAWIKPEATNGTRNIVVHGRALKTNEIYLRTEDNQYQFGFFRNELKPVVPSGNVLVSLPIPPSDQLGLDWVHLAGVYDGARLMLYRNGVLGASLITTQGAFLLSEDWAIGANPDPGASPDARRAFKGQLDEVRIWKRARTQEEILADMNRRLGGNETDLVGYWHFDQGKATGYSRHKIDGRINGSPKLVTSALGAYSLFAGVNDLLVQSPADAPAACGNWTHLAAAFDQSYGVEFDGKGGHLDCGNDLTLDISGDLTIEISLTLNDLDDGHGLLSRGRFNDSNGAQDVPYAFAILPSGKLQFSFENVEHKLKTFDSTDTIGRGSHKIAVTRKRVQNKEETKDNNGKIIKVEQSEWDEITFYIQRSQGLNVTTRKYESEPLADDDNRRPVDVGNSDQPLRFGETIPGAGAGLRGVISQVRIWNTARDAASVFKELNGGVKGLVSWWRFEENSGSVVADSKSNNHAQFKGSLKWVKNPDPLGSTLKLYVNGMPVTTAAVPAADRLRFTTNAQQFSIGAVAEFSPKQLFQGELEEVRIWRTTRTGEQIQDNLFRRVTGEEESLIAWYTFDAESGGKVADQSLSGNHLAGVSTPPYVFSTAPIGDDTPQVRSALAGVKTTFNGLIYGTPATGEYGDLQNDSQGNLIGVLKRGYAYVGNGEWSLITGYKVGDLTTEWVGQVQFAPQLIGFIEGAPPVPSENLTTRAVEGIGDLDDYNEASTIELTQAETSTYTYSASKEGGFDMAVELAARFGGAGQVFVSTPVVPLGPIVLTEVVEASVGFGIHANFELSQHWLEEAARGSGRTISKSTGMELRGRFEGAASDPTVGRRFQPDNIGLALVQSETADVFALRLRHNNALIAMQMRPNPDIPKDWNIIQFQINPRYTKQGTLDGKIGFQPDESYPNALDYSPDSSYFKPLEAYALKNRLEREEQERRAIYENFNAEALGERKVSYGSDKDLLTGTAKDKLPKFEKRNLVNTYVWTADGSFFAETQEAMDFWQESYGGSYAFTGMAGIDLGVDLVLGPVLVQLELQAVFGGQLNLTVQKSRESESSFGLNVGLEKVERDIFKRNENGVSQKEKQEGKVDAYRFMTFFLEPKSDHFDLFYNRVVDPIWLNQSDDPGAAALREARQAGSKPPCWRVMHRVTYVSRVLPRFEAKLSSLEKTMQTLDIDSNYELIKQLEPFVINQVASLSNFSDAVAGAIKRQLPELQPHTKEIIQFLSLYYGLSDGQSQLTRGEQDAISVVRSPNQPPLVFAGPDPLPLGLDGAEVELELNGVAIDDRLDQSSALFVTWEWVPSAEDKKSGKDKSGAVRFDDPHALDSKVFFKQRGRYVLRLTASDGQLQSSDEVMIVVNQRPVIQAVLEKVEGMTAQLVAQIIDDGLADPQAGNVTVEWSKLRAPGMVVFAPGDKPQVTATFDSRGHYLLNLRVNNGTLGADAQLLVAVAARATAGLQALYAFEDNDGATVRDVSGAETPVNLTISDPARVSIGGGKLNIVQPALLVSLDGNAARLARAIKASNEITVEAWINPAAVTVTSPELLRIVTMSDGPTARNFTLGQIGDRCQFHLRTSAANPNANDKVLAARLDGAGAKQHLVCTRDKDGLTRIYRDGIEISRRKVSGNFASWSDSFRLALGNEATGGDGHNRAWLGDLHLVAIYDRALADEEVRQNHSFGADANLPPTLTAGTDRVVGWEKPDVTIRWKTKDDVSERLVKGVSVPLRGRITHDRRASKETILWTQIGGPPGVEFENASLAATNALFTQKGRYLLRLTVDDGELMSSDEVAVTVHRPPVIEMIQSASFALLDSQATTTFVAEVTDTGLGDENEPGRTPGRLTYLWRRADGPASATIDKPDQLNPSVTFTERGAYRFELTVSNGHLATTGTISLFVNQRPKVTAGNSQIITLPEPLGNGARLALQGQVSDTGTPVPSVGVLDIKWTPVSGPSGARVDFDDRTRPDTGVSFKASGIYVLQLTATSRTDSTLTASAQVTVIVNQRPVVNAGPRPTQPLLVFGGMKLDGTISNDELKLDGTVSDDGLPESPGAVTLRWEDTANTGGVNFSNPASDYTTARFTAKGRYTLRLTADDGAPNGQGRASDEFQVLVHGVPGIKTGGDQTVKAGAQLQLRGEITDTGIGDAQPAQMSAAWTVQSVPSGITGSGQVNFSETDATGLVTKASFTKDGIYILQLEASNGFLKTAQTIRVTVTK